MWRKPVGLGAKRTTGGMRRIVGTVLIGAHVSSAGGIHTAIDRAEAMGADSVQVFTQSPRMWRPTNHPPENIERFKERRAEAGIDGVLCHALYLVNLANPKDDLYEKSVAALSNTVDVGLRDRGGRRRLPRRLASRRGHGRGAQAGREGDEEGARPLLGDDVAADGELARARARRSAGRSKSWP